MENISISSPAHAIGLIGVLQQASGHPDGIIGALGHGNHTAWFSDNVHSLFQPDGPLSAFQPVNASTFGHHLTSAQHLAQSYSDRTHSNESTGTQHEDIPDWVRQFFVLFDAQQNQSTSNQ